MVITMRLCGCLQMNFKFYLNSFMVVASFDESFFCVYLFFLVSLHYLRGLKQIMLKWNSNIP